MDQQSVRIQNQAELDLDTETQNRVSEEQLEIHVPHFRKSLCFVFWALQTKEIADFVYCWSIKIYLDNIITEGWWGIDKDWVITMFSTCGSSDLQFSLATLRFGKTVGSFFVCRRFTCTWTFDQVEVILAKLNTKRSENLLDIGRVCGWVKLQRNSDSQGFQICTWV